MSRKIREVVEGLARRIRAKRRRAHRRRAARNRSTGHEPRWIKYLELGLVAAGVLVGALTLIGLNEQIQVANTANNVSALTLQQSRRAVDQAQSAALDAQLSGADSLVTSLEANRLTMESNRQALDFFKNDQRAWLQLITFEPTARKQNAGGSFSPWEVREPALGEQLMYRIHLRNVGKTPAFNLGSNIQVALALTPLTDRIPDVFGGQTPVGSTLFPGEVGQYLTTGPISITPQLFENYRSGAWKLQIDARVFYCDVARRRHWTHACAVHSYASSRSDLTRVDYCFGGRVGDDDERESLKRCL